VPRTALASSVEELLTLFGLEDTWQSITITRQVELEGSSVTHVTIDFLDT
jgi:hypothetical protein